MRYISTKIRKVADHFLFKFPAGCSGAAVEATTKGGAGAKG